LQEENARRKNRNTVIAGMERFMVFYSLPVLEKKKLSTGK
jgi:hypothetical protein